MEQDTFIGKWEAKATFSIFVLHSTNFFFGGGVLVSNNCL